MGLSASQVRGSGSGGSLQSCSGRAARVSRPASESAGRGQKGTDNKMVIGLAELCSRASIKDCRDLSTSLAGTTLLCG